LRKENTFTSLLFSAFELGACWGGIAVGVICCPHTFEPTAMHIAKAKNLKPENIVELLLGKLRFTLNGKDPIQFNFVIAFRMPTDEEITLR
jgi:hypothetical protein